MTAPAPAPIHARQAASCPRCGLMVSPRAMLPRYCPRCLALARRAVELVPRVDGAQPASLPDSAARSRSAEATRS